MIEKRSPNGKVKWHYLVLTNQSKLSSLTILTRISKSSLTTCAPSLKKEATSTWKLNLCIPLTPTRRSAPARRSSRRCRYCWTWIWRIHSSRRRSLSPRSMLIKTKEPQYLRARETPCLQKRWLLSPQEASQCALPTTRASNPAPLLRWLQSSKMILNLNKALKRSKGLRYREPRATLQTLFTKLKMLRLLLGNTRPSSPCRTLSSVSWNRTRPNPTTEATSQVASVCSMIATISQSTLQSSTAKRYLQRVRLITKTPYWSQIMLRLAKMFYR